MSRLDRRETVRIVRCDVYGVGKEVSRCSLGDPADGHLCDHEAAVSRHWPAAEADGEELRPAASGEAVLGAATPSCASATVR